MRDTGCYGGTGKNGGLTLNEIWKDIPHYEGLYQVSNYGRVKSVGRYVEYTNRWGGTSKQLVPERIKAQSVKSNGYQTLVLYKNNMPKNEYVHRLVAMAFIPNPKNLPQVNHKDEDKANNVVDNLEWCDNNYNNSYNGKRQRGGRTLKENCFTSTQIIKCDMEGNELEYYLSMNEAERMNGLANGVISKYFQNGYKQCGGFTWKKIEED